MDNLIKLKERAEQASDECLLHPSELRFLITTIEQQAEALRQAQERIAGLANAVAQYNYGFLNQGERITELEQQIKDMQRGEPVKWFNGCHETVPEALRFLAENDRPIGGEERFNSLHLYQLADEIELMAKKPLFPHSAPVRPAMTDEEIYQLSNDVYRQMNTDYGFEVASPISSIQAVRLARAIESASQALDFTRLQDAFTKRNLVWHERQQESINTCANMLLEDAFVINQLKQRPAQLSDAEMLDYELDGVIYDAEHNGFDNTCLNTIKRVREALAAGSDRDGEKCTNSDSWNCKYCNKTKTCAAIAAQKGERMNTEHETIATWLRQPKINGRKDSWKCKAADALESLSRENAEQAARIAELQAAQGAQEPVTRIPLREDRTLIYDEYPYEGFGHAKNWWLVNDDGKRIRELNEYEEGFINAALKVQRQPVAPVQGEPVKWFNGCHETVPEALRYLAENERPREGESRFNAEHLYQLADEIERMATSPLYRHAAPISVLTDAEILDKAATFGVGVIFRRDGIIRPHYYERPTFQADVITFARAILASAVSKPAPSLSDEQENFEKWANSHGGVNLSPVCSDGATRNGLFPATYWDDTTEIAWRAYANKPAIEQRLGAVSQQSSEDVIYTAFHKCGCDVAGIKWGDFVAAMQEKGAQP